MFMVSAKWVFEGAFEGAFEGDLKWHFGDWKLDVEQSPWWLLLALPTKARIIVFRFIIEYRSLMDFGPY
jgi:hypothetical protein